MSGTTVGWMTAAPWAAAMAVAGVLAAAVLARCYRCAHELLAGHAVDEGRAAELARGLKRYVAWLEYLSTLPTSVGLFGTVVGLCLEGPTGAAVALRSTAIALAMAVPLGALFFGWIRPLAMEALGAAAEHNTTTEGIRHA